MTNKLNFSMQTENSYLFGTNAPYIEEQYEIYLSDPSQVCDELKQYFDSLQMLSSPKGTNDKDVSHGQIIESFAGLAKRGATGFATVENSELSNKKVAVKQLIDAYRNLGHKLADLDPLKRFPTKIVKELEPSFYGLTDADLDTVFNVSNTFFAKNEMSLRELVNSLKQTYCGSLGVEFMYSSNLEEKNWWQQQLESILSVPDLTVERKKQVLERLTAAEGLERFLHTKYVGQKRFSLEGGESFIVAMDEAINSASLNGVNEIVIGMAHRGRLNVLVNTLGKLPKNLFAEFEHTAPEDLPSGDVKYHQGFSSKVQTQGGVVSLILEYNPSHLEIVNPVVQGSVRARMDRIGDTKGEKVLPILVHGDSALGGQGVVMETLALSQTRGYYTGGTLHMVVNNQVGFTTSDLRDIRSTEHCTDVLKMIEAPILHVNADDPESVVLAIRLATLYRTTFHKDVIVDIVCFRKLGHNEQDTPALTQPFMYSKVAAHPGTRKLYADKLKAQGLGDNLGAELVAQYRAILDKGTQATTGVVAYSTNEHWRPFLNQTWQDEAKTAISLSTWKRLSAAITNLPDTVNPHNIVKKLFADRSAMAKGEINVDWGMAEHMAYASLLDEGFPVRLSGEDSGRGTFVHRHAVVHNQKREKSDEGTYIPLANVSAKQATFTVIDSVLSEEGVLGFEYGYSCVEPNNMVIWEGQFGDFANGAQVVIDQFIASAEVKWGRLNGLTMLLPHGYEGQGPEHSSARLERYMQLAADFNMQITQPTTASQIFHLLRRQMIRNIRKPLIIMSPKSLLRNKDAGSPLNEFTKGTFQTVIGETDNKLTASKVKRLVICSGKVYFDLVKYRSENNIKDVAIIRLEQLYPFPEKAFKAEFAKYPKLKEVVWCQDEPKNQGAWYFLQNQIYSYLVAGQSLAYAGRNASAAPAVGYAHLHQHQQQALLKAAFGKADISLIK